VSTWTYLPILKWKQGERRAVEELSPSQWQSIVPLLELLSINASPDSAGLNAAVPAYVQKIAKGFTKCIPEDIPIVVDVRWVAPGYPKQARLLRAISRGLAKASGRRIIPSLSESMVVNEAAELASFADFDEVVLRIRTTALEASQVPALVKLALDQGLAKKNLHLVVDQYSLVNEDPTARFTKIRPYLDEAISRKCASVTVAGGSFPVNLIGFKQGIHTLRRVEWLVWEKLKVLSDYDEVLYADYTVSNPGPLPEGDPDKMNPSVAIRYAADTYWKLFKAGGFKKGAPNQYRGLCTLLRSDKVYSGPSFSFGDECYDKAANGLLGNGNPSSWRRDATSHHLVFTAGQL
jgi:hypothetical protein